MQHYSGKSLPKPAGKQFNNQFNLYSLVTNTEVAERVGVESMEGWLRRQRLRWYGHLLRRGEDTEVGRVLTMAVAGCELGDNQQGNREGCS